jgi:hypothetical protein
MGLEVLAAEISAQDVRVRERAFKSRNVCCTVVQLASCGSYSLRIAIDRPHELGDTCLASSSRWPSGSRLHLENCISTSQELGDVASFSLLLDDSMRLLNAFPVRSMSIWIRNILASGHPPEDL